MAALGSLLFCARILTPLSALAEALGWQQIMGAVPGRQQERAATPSIRRAWRSGSTRRKSSTAEEISGARYKRVFANAKLQLVWRHNCSERAKRGKGFAWGAARASLPAELEMHSPAISGSGTLELHGNAQAAQRVCTKKAKALPPAGPLLPSGHTSLWLLVAHALERCAILLAVHKPAGLGVALGPLPRLGVCTWLRSRTSPGR